MFTSEQAVVIASLGSKARLKLTCKRRNKQYSFRSDYSVFKWQTLKFNVVVQCVGNSSRASYL